MNLRVSGSDCSPVTHLLRSITNSAKTVSITIERLVCSPTLLTSQRRGPIAQYLHNNIIHTACCTRMQMWPSRSLYAQQPQWYLLTLCWCILQSMQSGDLWTVIRTAMSGAIRPFVGGGQTPWICRRIKCISRLVIATKAAAFEGHVGLGGTWLHVQKEFRNLYKARSTARINFQQGYDSHEQMIFGYQLAQR